MFACDQCQPQGTISKRHELPMTPFLELEVFNVWGIDFMGPFVSLFGMHILVVVGYVSKRVEPIALPNNEAHSITAFFRKNIFSQFGMPRAIIIHRGPYFYNYLFKSLLEKYGVNHRMEKPYHPLTSEQVKVSNREIKFILVKTVNVNRTDWPRKLDNALWGYHTTYKTPIGVSSTQILNR